MLDRCFCALACSDGECGTAEDEVTESDVYKNWNKLQPQERRAERSEAVLSNTCSFGSVLEKKLAAEEYIKKRHSQADARFPTVKTETTRLRSGLDYTIIRPARLPEGMGQKCMARALMCRCQCPMTSPEMRLCCNIITRFIIATDLRHLNPLFQLRFSWARGPKQELSIDLRNQARSAEFTLQSRTRGGLRLFMLTARL